MAGAVISSSPGADDGFRKGVGNEVAERQAEGKEAEGS